MRKIIHALRINGSRASPRELIINNQPTTLSSQTRKLALAQAGRRFSQLLNKKNYFSISWVKFRETGAL